MNIFLIDDDELVNMINKRLLELCEFGENISTFTSSKAALDFINVNSRNQSLLPDLLILDIKMPNLDGANFIQEFIKISCMEKCNVVVLSGMESNDEEVDYILKNKCVIKFLSKPLTKQHIELLKKQISMM